MAESCDDKCCVKFRRIGFQDSRSTLIQVNALFERKVELLMGGTASAFGSTSEESFNSSRQSILEEGGWRGGGGGREEEMCREG